MTPDRFAERLDALVHLARTAPGDVGGLERLAAAAAQLVGSGAVVEAGFETSDIVDDRSLTGRLHAHGVDRVLVDPGTNAGALLALARALASDDGPVPEPVGVRVEYLPLVRGPVRPLTPPRAAGPIPLVAEATEAARTPRPRTALGREMDALRRAVEAAARRGAWSEALHAAQALIRLEVRVPASERRGFAIQVKRSLGPEVLREFVAIGLRVPEEHERVAELLRWVGLPAADVLVDQLRLTARLTPLPLLQETLAVMPEAEPLLRPLLHDPQPAVAAQAALLLGGLGAAAAVPELAECGEHPAAEVRLAALGALTRIGGQAVVEPLHRALAHPHAPTRAAAAAGLGGLDDPGLVMPLVAALERETDPTTRQALVAALGSQAGAPAERALRAVLLRRRGWRDRTAWPLPERVAAVAVLAGLAGGVARAVLARLAVEAEGEVARAAEAATRTPPGATGS